jgi:hypothetical protein
MWISRARKHFAINDRDSLEAAFPLSTWFKFKIEDNARPNEDRMGTRRIEADTEASLESLVLIT